MSLCVSSSAALLVSASTTRRQEVERARREEELKLQQQLVELGRDREHIQRWNWGKKQLEAELQASSKGFEKKLIWSYSKESYGELVKEEIQI